MAHNVTWVAVIAKEIMITDETGQNVFVFP